MAQVLHTALVKPNLRLSRCVNPLSCRGFTVPGGFCWCLLQGERDGGAEQGEGLPLHGGGGDDLVDLLAADGDGVAGEGGQVVDLGCPGPSGLRILIGSSAERTGSRVRDIPEVLT